MAASAARELLPAGPAGYSAFGLSVNDWSGQERKGQVVIAWQEPWEEAMALGPGEDFRIVVLAKPASDPAISGERLAVCIPAHSLGWRPAVREASPTYLKPAQDRPAFSLRDVTALSGGRICAGLDLDVGPEAVFGLEGVRLELLAQDILQQIELKPYRKCLDQALAAPAPPHPTEMGTLQQRLRQLVKKGEPSLAQADAPGQWPEAEQALRRLAELASAADGGQFLATASRLYVRPVACAEDVYLARALAERRQEAIQWLSMRRFLGQAIVPLASSDLAVDRFGLENQLAFAQLVAEPRLTASVVASFASFQGRYRKAYLAHHDHYWRESLAIHSRLMDAAPQVDALRRLNTLTELGPPVGEGAAAAFARLMDETAGCPLSGRLKEELADSPLCPACGLTLDRELPGEQAGGVLERVRRALHRKMTHLSSTGVQQVLARSGDPRVEQFLKVVQASQLASLPEVVDDALLGFLRRFLVEARIQEVLQPIISRLETGPAPKEEEAEQVMREVARVLQRAFRAARRSLPAPSPDRDIRA